MNGLSFETTDEEDALIELCAARARACGDSRPVVMIRMDLAATNASGCPLDFEKLLAFDDFSFWHDITGIYHHLDRETGKLEDFFLPRCAR